MAKRSRKPKSKFGKSPSELGFKIVHQRAAGIDIGSRENWACIGDEKEDIRKFGVFTEDHHEMAKWFQSNGVETIAMESTGIYWKSLFLILQSYGFEVILVNAGYVKNVPGKKTDIKDCHWIWQLHSVGLLHASFQPDEFTEELRTYNRHRRTLIEDSSKFVSRMQKALLLMNIHLPTVLSDITGKSGTIIIEHILKGERDAKTLAALASPRVKANKQTIEKALTGQWHSQYLFTLKQNWEMYQYYHKQIKDCDDKIDALLSEKVEQTGKRDLVYEPVKKKQRKKNCPKAKVDLYAYQLTDGVDLMEIEGFSFTALLTLLAETGWDLKAKFPTAKNFTSWLSLSPNKRITGGKVKSSRTNKNKHPLAYAFRQAANSAGNTKDTALGQFFRRLAYKKGRKYAVTATARKIATIVYNMITRKEPYRPMGTKDYQEKVREQKIKSIHKSIKDLGLTQDDLVFA